MVRHRRMLFSVTVTVLACALAAVAIAALAHGPVVPAPTTAPLAVVLAPGIGRSELIVIDLERARVVRRIVLRSLVTDIGVDTARGTVVGAQTGGLGDDADNAISVVDPRTGDVRYVTLARTDPSQVECVGGRAVVLHSWVDSSGFVVSTIDLASESLVAGGHAPDGTGLWASAAGSLWTGAAVDDGRGSILVRLDPATLAATTMDTVSFAPTAVTSAGDSVAVLGSTPGDPPGTGRVALFDAGGMRVVATATVSGLPHGPQAAALVGETLVVGDWNGDSPESASLAVLDRRTLDPLARITVGSTPCALAGLADGLLVVDRAEGVLRRVDPMTGEVAWIVDLGVRDLVCSQVVVFPRGRTAQ